MPYRIAFSAEARAGLASLPEKIRNQVGRKIEELANNPRPPQCKKLKHPSERYRVRSGDYRIVYQIKDDVLLVLIVRVGHRREVYRHLP